MSDIETDMAAWSKSLGDMTRKWTEDVEKNSQKIKDLLWRRAKDFTFGWLPLSEVKKIDPTWSPKELVPEGSYVEIRMKSLHIPYQAIMIQTYFGTVHSFISLPSLSGGRAKFSLVTTPTDLQNVNAQGLSRVRQADIPLLGNVPYRGGDINIEMGLFSVVASDLLAPFLKIVENISNTAGVSVINQAIPFVQPIESAIYHLLGYSNGNKLEVGIKTSLCKEGYLVIVAEEETDDFFSSLSLRPNWKLFRGGEELKCAYLVLTVKARPDRPNWMEIPDVYKAYDTLRTILKTTNQKDTIMKAFETFKKEALFSPELLKSDARVLVERIQKTEVEPTIA
jgi:hypothetical protein